MTSTSDATKNKISVYLGDETKWMEFPPKPGRKNNKFQIHPIGMKEIAKIETLCGIDFLDWEHKNPFKKLTVLMYALWLSVAKNPDLGYTEDEFNDMFNLFEAEVMFKLIGVVLEISGLKYIAEKQLKEKEGKEQGAAVSSEPAAPTT